MIFATLVALNHKEALECPHLNIDYQAILINRVGVNELIHNSSKPEAKMFKKWIANEVLPSIITTGSYTLLNNSKQKELDIQTLQLTNEKERLANEAKKLELAKLQFYKGVAADTDIPQHRVFIEQYIVNMLQPTNQNANQKALTYIDPESHMLVGVTQLAVEECGINPSLAQKKGISLGLYIKKKFEAKYDKNEIKKGRRIFSGNGSYIEPNTYKNKYKDEIVGWIKEYFTELDKKNKEQNKDKSPKKKRKRHKVKS